MKVKVLFRLYADAPRVLLGVFTDDPDEMCNHARTADEKIAVVKAGFPIGDGFEVEWCELQ